MSPVTYFGLPGADVTCVVVFAVLESSAHPVKKTQETRTKTRPITSTVLLFIVFTMQSDYFKKSFYLFIVSKQKASIVESDEPLKNSHRCSYRS
jgi:hypothetical protein